MIKINESLSLPQSSIKCNYCIHHTVKLLWCICWDVIYATYLQRGIDPTLWMSYKRAVECKLKEICGYWVWSVIWLIMTYFLNSAPYCTIFCFWPFVFEYCPCWFPSEVHPALLSLRLTVVSEIHVTGVTGEGWTDRQIWLLFFERQTIFANPESGGFPAQPAPVLWWDPVLSFLLCIGRKSNSK